MGPMGMGLIGMAERSCENWEWQGCNGRDVTLACNPCIYIFLYDEGMSLGYHRSYQGLGSGLRRLDDTGFSP